MSAAGSGREPVVPRVARAWRRWAACAVTAAALAAGCSSEQSVLTLAVAVTPNPVSGTDGEAGRTWKFSVAITNPADVEVTVEYFHAEITGTDTGYELPLVRYNDSAIVGQRIAAGETRSYDASRDSDGQFTRGRERRVYHALGSDGVYYSGEVQIELE